MKERKKQQQRDGRYKKIVFAEVEKIGGKKRRDLKTKPTVRVCHWFNIWMWDTVERFDEQILVIVAICT